MQKNLYQILLLFLATPTLVGGNAVKGNSGPLFPPGHENITCLTDTNFEEMVIKSKKKWLIDFYHPYCPHCISFVPDWITIAAFYKANGSEIAIGAVSCMTEVQCRRVAITGFPTLIAYNFNNRKPGTENARIIGTHTVTEVKDFVTKMTTEGAYNASNYDEEMKKIADAKLRAGEKKPIDLWEDSNRTMDQDSRMFDAASAFLLGLKQGIFTGSEVLEDMQLDALKEWLRVVSHTFPGTFNRRMIAELYDVVNPIPYLHVDHWLRILSEWQTATVIQHKAQNLAHFEHLPKWQQRSDLFSGDGSQYEVCDKYTCGQWQMFHMMTTNPRGEGMHSDEMLVSILGAMRRFMKYFFGCIQCRNHFLQVNTLKKMGDMYQAQNKTRFLKSWVWQMHNMVNERVGHPQWPKNDSCLNCGDAAKWKDANVLRWLDATYGIEEVDVTTSWWPSLRKNPAVVSVQRRTGEFSKNIQNPSMANDSMFMWYVLPFTCLGVYFLYVRPRVRRKDNK